MDQKDSMERRGMQTAVLADLLRQQLRESGTAVCRITSSSMSPLLIPDDRIHLRPGAQPTVGQIITVWTTDALQTHRLIRILPTGALLLRGDANQSADPIVAVDAVIGRVVTVERNGRWLSLTSGGGGWYSQWHARLQPLRQRSYLRRLTRWHLSWVGKLVWWRWGKPHPAASQTGR